MIRSKYSYNLLIINNMAERVGFEPTLPVRVNTLSKRAPSATRPSLRILANESLLILTALRTVRELSSVSFAKQNRI